MTYSQKKKGGKKGSKMGIFSLFSHAVTGLLFVCAVAA